MLKGIHGWRPTKQRLHVINKQRRLEQRTSTQSDCLLYQRHDETQKHMYQCSHENSHNFRIKCLQQITNYCRPKHTFPPVTKIITKYLHHWMENLPTQKTIPQQLEDEYDISQM